MAFFKQTFVDGVTVVQAAWLNGIQEVVGAAAVVPEYDNDQTYSKGALVAHDNLMYMASVNIGTPEDWNSSHWTQTSLEALLAGKEDVDGGAKIFWVTGGTTSSTEIDTAIENGFWPVINYNNIYMPLRGKIYETIGQQYVTRYPFEHVTKDGYVFFRELQHTSSGDSWGSYSSSKQLLKTTDLQPITNAQIDALF